MSVRHLPAMDYAALKAAVRELVRPLTGRGAASVTRVCQQTLSNYGSPKFDHVELFMPIDVVADLEAELGDFPITRALAELNNCILVPLPEGVGHGRLHVATGKTNIGYGELLKVIGMTLEDDVVDAQELTKITKAIGGLQVQLARLQQVAKKEHEANYEQ